VSSAAFPRAPTAAQHSHCQKTCGGAAKKLMESANSQDIMSVLRNDEAGANQRDNSRRKSCSANICRARRDHSQMPPQISGERQHQQSSQRQAAGSHPIMTGIITRRKQVGDDAVSPVIIFGGTSTRSQ